MLHLTPVHTPRMCSTSLRCTALLCYHVLMTCCLLVFPPCTGTNRSAGQGQGDCHPLPLHRYEKWPPSHLDGRLGRMKQIGRNINLHSRPPHHSHSDQFVCFRFFLEPPIILSPRIYLAITKSPLVIRWYEFWKAYGQRSPTQTTSWGLASAEQK